MTRSFFRAAVFALTGLAISAGAIFPNARSATAAEQLFVMLDYAKILKLESDASTVILGNPAIADATVFNKSMLVITGKSYGTTNLIVLDASGSEISSNIVTVRAADEGLVTVHRGSARESFDCVPNCQPSLVLGDNTGSFDTINNQISSRIAISEGSSTQ